MADLPSGEEIWQQIQGSRTAAPVEPGNIDLTNRPRVRNSDGSISTVRSIGVNFDGQEVLIPTVSDEGQILSNDEAINQYLKTGRHLGKFNSVAAANAYAERLHNQQADSLHLPSDSLQGEGDQVWDRLQSMRAGQMGSSPASPPALPDLSQFGEDLSRAAAVRTPKGELAPRLELQPRERFPDEAHYQSNPLEGIRVRRNIGQVLHGAGELTKAAVRDTAAAWANLPEAHGNVQAFLKGETQPFNEVVKPEDRNLLTDTSETIAGLLPMVGVSRLLSAAGVAEPVAAAAPFSLGEQGQFQPVEAAVLAAFPGASKIGEELALKLADRAGANIANPMVEAVVGQVGKYAGAQAWMEVSALPEYLQADPEERKRIWSHNFALNFAMHLPGLPGVTKEVMAEPFRRYAAEEASRINADWFARQDFSTTRTATEQRNVPGTVISPADYTATVRGRRGEGNGKWKMEDGREQEAGGTPALPGKQVPMTASQLQGEVTVEPTPEELHRVRQTRLAADREAQVAAAQGKEAIRQQAGAETGPSYERWLAQQELERSRAEGQAGPLGRGQGAEALGVPLQRTLPREELVPGPMERGEMARELGVPLRRNERLTANEIRRRLLERSQSQPEGPVEAGGSEAGGVKRPEGRAPGLIAGTKLEAWADEQIAQAGQGVGISAKPELAAAGVIKGAALLERGLREFGVWSKAMLREFPGMTRELLVDVWHKSLHRLEWLKYQPDYVPQYRLDLTPEEQNRVAEIVNRVALRSTGDVFELTRQELKEGGFSGLEAQSAATWKNSRAQVYAKDPVLGNVIDQIWEYQGPEAKLLPEGVTLNKSKEQDQGSGSRLGGGALQSQIVEHPPTEKELHRGTELDDVLPPEAVISGDAVLKAIIARSTGAEQMLAQRLYDAGVFVPVTRTRRLSANAWADYTRFSDGRELISLGPASPDQIRDTLHEFVHAGTIGALQKDIKYRQEMQGYWERVKEAVSKESLTHPAFSDLYEFVTYAFEDKSLQKVMEGISLREGSGVLSNLWFQFVNLVRRIIGLPENTGTMLEAVIKESVKRFGITPAETRSTITLKSLVREPKQAEEIRQELEAEAPGRGAEVIRALAASELPANVPAIRQTINDLLAIRAQKPRYEKGKLVEGMDWSQNPEAKLQWQTNERVLNDRWVQSQFVEPVAGVQYAAEVLGDKLASWAQLVDDPKVEEALKSRATREAYYTYDQFDQKYQGFRAHYNLTKPKLEEEISELAQAADWSKTQQMVYEVLWDDLLASGKEIAQQAQDKGALTAYANMAKDSVRSRKILDWLARDVDWHTVVNGIAKTTDDLMGLVEQAAAGETPLEQVIEANREAIRYVANLVMQSEPMRQRMFEGADLLKEKARNYPLHTFMDQIAEKVKAGDVKGAIKAFGQGVGRTAEEARLVREAAAFFGRKVWQKTIELNALEEVKNLFEGMRSSPQFLETQQRVFSGIGPGLLARDVIMGYDPSHRYLETFPLKPGGKTYKINFSTSAREVDANAQAWQEFKAEAEDYLANPKDPDYHQAKAVALSEFLKDYWWYNDPMVNPRLGHKLERVQPGWLLQMQNRALFGLDEIPEFVLKYGAGPGVEFAHRTGEAYSTSKEVGYSIWTTHEPRKAEALRAALKAHGDMDLAIYRRQIHDRLAASRQYFENPGRLDVGMTLSNGYKILPQDMAFLRAEREYNKAIIRKFTGQDERAHALLETNPAAILENFGSFQRLRRPADTGPDTLDRHDDPIRELAREWRLVRSGATSPRPSPPKAEREKKGDGKWQMGENGTVNGAIELLNRGVHQWLDGYVQGAREHTFRFEYRFGAQLKEIEFEARAGKILGSFDDLVTRITDKYNAQDGVEGLTKEEVAQTVLTELDSMIQKAEPPPKPGESKSLVQVVGGSHSLNTPRGEQIFPSLWYEYGAVTTGENVAYYANATSRFYINHVEAVRALYNNVADILKRFEQAGREEGMTRSKSRQLKIDGHDYYSWGQTEQAEKFLKRYLSRLQQMGQMEQSFNSDAAKGFGAGVSSTIIPSLLTGPNAYIMNRAGGMFMAVARDIALRQQNALVAGGKEFAHFFPGLLVKAADLITHEGKVPLLNDVTGGLYHFMKWSGSVPFLGKLSKWLGESVDARRALRQEGIHDGLVQNKDLWLQLKSLLDWAGTGGVVSEIAPTGLGKVGKPLLAGAKGFGKAVGQVGVGWVDTDINLEAYQPVREQMRDLEGRARLYGKLREQRARQEGRDPFDLTQPENRFSDRELVGARYALLRGGEPLAAAKTRDFYRRKIGLNLDQALWDYYKSFRDAQAKEVAEKLPEGSLTQHLQLFSDSQLRQIYLAYAGEVNLPTFFNRPDLLHTSKYLRALSIFKGYPAWASQQLASWMTDQLSTRSVPKAALAALPVIISLAVAMAVIGPYATGSSDLLKRMVGRFGSVPTVFDALYNGSPKQYALATASGMANMWPVVGDLYNMVSGNAFKRGFDFNNQLVYLNFATDAARALKEMWQTREPGMPALRFAQRWTFPANYLTPFLPQVRGLVDFQNTRNVLSREAAINGMEAQLKKSFSSIDVNYTPATPRVNRLMNAVGVGDPAGMKQRWEELVGYYTGTGLTPQEAQKRALQNLQSRNPLTQVFGAKPTDQQFQGLLASMTPREKEVVTRTLHNYDAALAMVGKTASYTKEGAVAARGSKPKVVKVARTKGQNVLSRLRSRAIRPVGLTRVRRMIGSSAGRTAKKKRTRIAA